MEIAKLLGRIMACAICCAWLVGVAVPSHAADIKAAKISVPDVLKNSLRVKNAEEELRKIQFASEGKISGLRDAITKLREQLKSEEGQLKPEDKSKLEGQLKDKIEEFQQEQKTLEAKLTLKNKSVQNVIWGQLRELISKIAKEEGYGVIHNAQGLLYSEGLPDLTQKITQALDAMPASENQKE